MTADCTSYGCCDGAAWEDAGAVAYCCADGAYSYAFDPTSYPMCAPTRGGGSERARFAMTTRRRQAPDRYP